MREIEIIRIRDREENRIPLPSQECVPCEGTGKKRWSRIPCPFCKGTGIRPANLTRLCPKCKGSGRRVYGYCGRCGGHGYVEPYD
jgi:DnaJ-class molecular chaperone